MDKIKLIKSLGMKLQVKVFPPTGKTHSGTVIFFHGSGITVAPRKYLGTNTYQEFNYF